MLSERDALFYEQRIENYKELLRQHHREGERLKRELVAVQRAYWAKMPAAKYCATLPLALVEFMRLILQTYAERDSSRPGPGRPPAPALVSSDGRRLVTIVEAARHLRTTRGRIYGWIQRGEVQATGYPQRIYLDDVERRARSA